MQTIYVVEDEDSIRELVTYALQNAGFKVIQFKDGRNLHAHCLKEMPDLIILDIMLPYQDGISLLEQLKADQATKDIPVMMLTAKGTELDKVKGLDGGADDYITKPFSVMELISRIKAILRRAQRQFKQQAVLTVGALRLEQDKRTVTVAGQTIDLTYREFELLAYLMRHPEIVLSRAQILEALWGYDFIGESRTVDMHIKALRQKLGQHASYIQTVRNVGYVLKPPDKM